MKILTISPTTQLCCSEETYQEYLKHSQEFRIYPDDPIPEEPTEEVLDDALDGFLYSRLDPEVKGFLEAYASNGPIVILDAHGAYDNVSLDWTFIDGGIPASVQGWVDSQDGIASTIILLVCDTREVLQNPPRTKESILIVGDGIVRSGTLSEIMGTQHTFQVLHPTYGEIDSYTIQDAKKTLLK